MERPVVLLLFGGESSEHEVSIASARNVYAAIDNQKYDVLLGYIDKTGKWWLLDEFYEDIETEGAHSLVPALGKGGFEVYSGDFIRPDVILPILHGKNGEDGSVQGLARLLHIPIAGCGIMASAVAMDKLRAKRLASQAGVSVVPYLHHHTSDGLPTYSDVASTLGYEVFVKPNEAGSSVGVNKVRSEGEFHAALDAARQHSDIVLIETAIKARELEVAVLGDYPNLAVSEVGEIVPDGEFYSYDSKYASGSTSQVVIPAELPQGVAAKVKLWAETIYTALGCEGLARVDFFLDNESELYFNEINTMPGFTNISMYPKLMKARGVEYSELIDRLISMRLVNKS